MLCHILHLGLGPKKFLQEWWLLNFELNNWFHLSVSLQKNSIGHTRVLAINNEVIRSNSITWAFKC
jgi:hypothetical protein